MNQDTTASPSPTFPPCNVCGSTLAMRFEHVRDPQSLESFSIAACSNCALGHTLPQPEDLGRYYGAAYHGGRHGLTGRYCAWRRTKFVDTVAGPANGRSLLDIGCGDGTFLLAAKARGWEIAGTEMNPTVAREAGVPVWERLDEVAHAAPFGCITMWHTLEHMRDPRGMVEQAATLLAPDGVFFIAVPDAAGWQAKLFGAGWFHLDVPRHLFHFGEGALNQLLAGVKLRIVRRWHQEFEIDLFGWSQSVLNRVMPTPNDFFYQLTGRPTRTGALGVAANFVLGTALSGAALPCTAAGTLSGKGGTLVIAARRA